jgi:hypothetical protein
LTPSRRQGTALRCRLGVWLLAVPMVASAAPIEQVVGGIDAMVFACAPIDAKSAKTGSELLEKARVQRRLDLAAIRSTDSYKAMYNSEVNRLLALPPKDRLSACQTAW